MGAADQTYRLLNQQYNEQKAAADKYLYDIGTAGRYYEQQDQIETLESILESLQQPTESQAEQPTEPATNTGAMLFVFVIAIITFLSKRK